MDLELLNFWISELGMNIKGNTLSLHLKACDHDCISSYLLELSNDKEHILSFLGFDTSRNYDNMTESNLFEFLCTSTKLHPRNITFCSFKGRHPKDKTHERFDKLLKKKFSEQSVFKLHSDECNNSWVSNAVTFFNKEPQYEKYLARKAMFNKLNTVRNSIPCPHLSGFSQFLLLHGMYNVLQWDDEKVQRRWKRFQSEEWSGLNRFMINE
jgi:hypothetical protein